MKNKHICEALPNIKKAFSVELFANLLLRTNSTRVERSREGKQKDFGFDPQLLNG